MASINYLRKVRNSLMKIRHLYLTKVWGMDIHPSVKMSLSCKLDKVFPAGVHVDENSYLAFESRILTHDMVRGMYTHTYVGKNCFIGGRATILPGVKVGDGSIVGACAVVTRDVPAGSVVAGNPAQVIKSDIKVGPYGRFDDANEMEKKCREENDFHARG